MSAHRATIEWKRGDQPFVDKRYSRVHSWTFDGGAVVPASSAPASVPVPMSDASAVDPEEAMIASLSSCHMLWFLAFAAHADLVVDSYRDAASGELPADGAADAAEATGDDGDAWCVGHGVTPETRKRKRRGDRAVERLQADQRPRLGGSRSPGRAVGATPPTMVFWNSFQSSMLRSVSWFIIVQGVWPSRPPICWRNCCC